MLGKGLDMALGLFENPDREMERLTQEFESFRSALVMQGMSLDQAHGLANRQFANIMLECSKRQQEMRRQEAFAEAFKPSPVDPYGQLNQLQKISKP